MTERWHCRTRGISPTCTRSGTALRRQILQAHSRRQFATIPRSCNLKRYVKLQLRGVSLRSAAALPEPILGRPMPGTGEQVPMIGLGSWLTFDVVVARFRRTQCPPVGGARSTAANARWWTCRATPGKIRSQPSPGLKFTNHLRESARGGTVEPDLTPATT